MPRNSNKTRSTTTGEDWRKAKAAADARKENPKAALEKARTADLFGASVPELNSAIGAANDHNDTRLALSLKGQLVTKEKGILNDYSISTVNRIPGKKKKTTKRRKR